jgi:hypothetical protein
LRPRPQPYVSRRIRVVLLDGAPVRRLPEFEIHFAALNANPNVG